MSEVLNTVSVIPDTVSRLYCGRDMQGQTITDDMVAAFEHGTVSRLFPDGYTRIDGTGAWMDRESGETIHEPTVIFEVAHSRNDSRVADLANAWKQAFRQQAVMVAESPAQLRFV